MMKEGKLRQLFAALVILSLAILVITNSGCSTRDMVIEVREDGWGRVRSGGSMCCGEAANGDILHPLHVAALERHGAQLVFVSEQARANWQALQSPPPPQNRPGKPSPLGTNPYELPSNTIEGGGPGGAGVGGGKP